MSSVSSPRGARTIEPSSSQDSSTSKSLLKQRVKQGVLELFDNSEPTALSSEAEDVYVAIAAALGMDALAQLALEGTAMVQDDVSCDGASHSMRGNAARMLLTLWLLRKTLHRKLSVAIPELEIAIRTYI